MEVFFWFRSVCYCQSALTSPSLRYLALFSVNLRYLALVGNFPEPPTTGIFLKSIAGTDGRRLSSRRGSQRGTALQMGGVLRYKLEVYCQYFSDKLYGLGVPGQCSVSFINLRLISVFLRDEKKLGP